MVADRRIREFAPEHEPCREGLRPDPHANQNSPRLDVLPTAGSARASFLQQPLREATFAIKAGEVRAAELRQQLDQMTALGHEMADAIRSERARADAEQESTKAAKEHAERLEQRARVTIRNLERRADVAEARLQAAQSWIEQVRSVVVGNPDPATFGFLGSKYPSDQ